VQLAYTAVANVNPNTAAITFFMVFPLKRYIVIQVIHRLARNWLHVLLVAGIGLPVIFLQGD
jgi:hypothetical protein